MLTIFNYLTIYIISCFHYICTILTLKFEIMVEFIIETTTINKIKYVVTRDITDNKIISVFPDIQELVEKIESLESTISDLERTIDSLR